MTVNCGPMNTPTAVERHLSLSQPLMRKIREAGTARRSVALRERNPYEYVSCWTEEDVLDGEPCDAMVLILATKGCSWALRSGCSMCGYTNESSSLATDDSVWKQYISGMRNFRKQKVLKIYTSGSFLDNFELSSELRRRILSDASQRFERIIVETRHEYITQKMLDELGQFRGQLTLAVGLESSNDLVVNYSVNKPSSFSHFVRAAENARINRFSIKSYIMLKPPFLSEMDAIRDASQTIRDVKRYADTISVNPTNIQKDTIVELLWKRGAYRPPWLWSVVEVLSGDYGDGARLMSKPTGAGTVRGAHNCGRCDRMVLDAISDFSVSQDSAVFDGLDCKCRVTWRNEVSISVLGNYATAADYRLGIAGEA
jgi:radical SAM enzyme (TIGR01210 family)